jgi:hypothetical protein
VVVLMVVFMGGGQSNEEGEQGHKEGLKHKF